MDNSCFALHSQGNSQQVSVLQAGVQEQFCSVKDDSSRPVLVHKADAIRYRTEVVQHVATQMLQKTAPHTGLHLKQDLHLSGLSKPLPVDVIADV